MKNFQKGGKLRQIMQSKLFLIFLGIAITAFFVNMFGLVNKMEETRKNRRIAEDKIAELEKSKKTFELDIARLKTQEGQEEAIREKYGVAKDGEQMILVVDDKSGQEAEKEADSSGFLDFFKNWFK